MAIGEPFLFCGRIIEAYYSNPELDTVAILWSDGKTNREYYVKVDEEDDQFNALLAEFNYESIDECTRNRNEATRQEFRDAFHKYATHGNDGTNQTIDISGGLSNEEKQAGLGILFEYNEEDSIMKEGLFKLKLKMFEQPVVQKSKAKTKKAAIRKASSPLEAVVAYASFIK